MEEVWKDIPNYEGYYQASDFGNIRSIDRYVQISNGKKRLAKGVILKFKTNHSGYLTVNLKRDGGSKTCKVHRLVLESFIGKPDGKYCCHHLNSIKSDNRLENLQWVSYSDNSKLAYRDGLRKRTKFTPVEDVCNGIVYKSINDAAEAYDMAAWKCRSMLNGYSVNTTCLRYAS